MCAAEVWMGSVQTSAVQTSATTARTGSANFCIEFYAPIKHASTFKNSVLFCKKNSSGIDASAQYFEKFKESNNLTTKQEAFYQMEILVT